MNLHQMDGANRASMLRRRLLHDIDELQTNPYPGIDIHIRDEDALKKACLILTPEGQHPLHLTIYFTEDYPLLPPKVKMDSEVVHPNVFGGYVCASILNTREGYTSAYTLKGICIQLLSFFSSEKVEQDFGIELNLKEYATSGVGMFHSRAVALSRRAGFSCTKCRFGLDPSDTLPVDAQNQPVPQPQTTPTDTRDVDIEGAHSVRDPATTAPSEDSALHISNLSVDILVMFCDHMDDETLSLAARAWDGFENVLHEHNIIRTRELQCFTLKQSFRDVPLGVGVSVSGKKIHSEFDLLSSEAFFTLGVRESVHGIRFGSWLPLPIAERHWERVKNQVDLNTMLSDLRISANLSAPAENVIYTFMNDTVVRLSEQASGNDAVPQQPLYGERRSTLTHASERAIEAYFHLYHLLLCLATERPAVAKAADDLVNGFKNGRTSKTACSNLGHLLIAMLITDVPVDEAFMRSVIKEAITRNVVWMLDARGANRPELSFIEAEDESDYRLDQTFQASMTSYTVLMFQRLMQRTVSEARLKKDGSRMTLEEMKKQLFKRHGAPPHRAAARLATSIRQLQTTVTNWPQFLTFMGVACRARLSSEGS